MASDDLNAPLGQDKPNKPSKFAAAGPQLVAGLLALSGLVVVGWAALVNDPLGGEPVVVIATGQPAAPKAEPGTASDGTHHARHDGSEIKVSDTVAAATSEKPAVPAGSKTITIIDGSSGQRQDIVIPGPGDKPGKEAAKEAAKPPAKPPVDPKMLEPTRHGTIPKVGTDGARPASVYALPRQVPANRKDFPRIAIVIGALGISAAATADAFSDLPASVTFALAPYGADLEKLAQRARGEGHEVLLQVPMEPFDYPDNDPGPQTLLTTLSADQNIDRLHWLMSRFQGYVGFLGSLGARFTASEQAIGPVLAEAAKRGLIYIDDGASPRSVAGQAAGSRNAAFARTDVVLDVVPTPAEVDRALARLELAARENGSAVGLAAAQPSTIARIAEWAKTVETRGFVLVPISMVALKAKSS